MITMDDGKKKPRKGKGRSSRLELEDTQSGSAEIRVIGIGGGGGNAINRMVQAKVEGVRFLAANTDCQALKNNKASIKLQLGSKLTKGLGAGGNPEIGRSSALEDTEAVIEALNGADMVFVTTGLGGGTGTGARADHRESGERDGRPGGGRRDVALRASRAVVVTGAGRRRGWTPLREVVDTVITIPNDKLLHTVEKGHPPWPRRS